MLIGELRGKPTRPIEAENNRPYKRQFSEDEAESDSSSASSSVSSTGRFRGGTSAYGKLLQY